MICQTTDKEMDKKIAGASPLDALFYLGATVFLSTVMVFFCGVVLFVAAAIIGGAG